MSEEVKRFLLDRVIGHLNEAYRNFLALENLLSDEERNEIKFWKKAKQLYFVARRFTRLRGDWEG